MRSEANRIGVLLVAIAVAGCGGSITGKGPMTGQGGATTTIPCSAMGACECMAASSRCSARVESCWCPSECNPQIACVCGGGRFLACEDKATVAACTTALTAVQAKCAGQSNVQWIADICTTAADPTCVAACLSNLATGGACTEIDCRFCALCDCGPATVPSPFGDCVRACAPPLPEQN